MFKNWERFNEIALQREINAQQNERNENVSFATIFIFIVYLIKEKNTFCRFNEVPQLQQTVIIRITR